MKKFIETLKNCWRIEDLRQRILITLLFVAIYRFGSFVVLPGINPGMLEKLQSQTAGGLMSLLDMFSGGAFSNASMFALGIMPYISASIVMQLLAVAVPYFQKMQREGESGRKKISWYTRILTVAILVFQAPTYLLNLKVQTPGALASGLTWTEFMIPAFIILTAGSMFILWLGERITDKGIGNGISLIIMAGIIANLPNMFYTAWNTLVDFSGTTQSIALGITMFTLFVIFYIAIVLGIVYEETAERRIPIQYANKSSNSYGGQQSYIPFRLNSAGVIPVIFASAIISIPSIIASFIKNDAMTIFINKWIVMTTPTGLLLYVLCIFGFAYFYTFIQLKPDELADNLNKNGGFIPGVRPGEETVEYITKVIKKITFVGAFALTIIAALPVLFGMFSNMPASVTIGGTGLLIVVGVALETYKQIESQLVSRSYTRGRRRR